jgi:hypothetical protein
VRKGLLRKMMLVLESLLAKPTAIQHNYIKENPMNKGKIICMFRPKKTNNYWQTHNYWLLLKPG